MREAATDSAALDDTPQVTLRPSKAKAVAPGPPGSPPGRSLKKLPGPMAPEVPMLSLAATARLPPLGGSLGPPRAAVPAASSGQGPGVLLGLLTCPQGSASPQGVAAHSGNQKSHSTNNNFLSLAHGRQWAGPGQAAPPNRPHFLLNSPLEHGDFQKIKLKTGFSGVGEERRLPWKQHPAHSGEF